MRNAEVVGDYLMDELRSLQKNIPLIQEVRGRGLMIGVELRKPEAARIVELSMHDGLLCNAATSSVIRFLPPLIATKEQVDECIGILKKVMQA
jgi:acetylornithine/succinyldiaminopimelate/putrescine aminotransferase